MFCSVLFASAGTVPVREVCTSITLQKGEVLRKALVLKTGHITIEGNGAVLKGPGAPGDLSTFQGAGISAEGISHVTIRNLTVRGFASGLVAENGAGWCIEGCDFSGNYHDPEYGWGDYKRCGGMILTNISWSIVRDNTARNVWNGCDLWKCSGNLIENNVFSHCSNVCLKLWKSCRNVVRSNDLSYGLRIRSGEVHARDSTCVLIESGSNNNRFSGNNITHGGDGVFIRVLNGWVSTGNVFRGNNCSYANNNGFESWSPGNVYVDNRANHCSYGFWLGGSDATILIGNEAAYNGRVDGFHNAPESDFGHGGIVIVHGTGSHSLIEDNFCHHNNGGGIVVRGDLSTRGGKWKMYHLVIQKNRLTHNRWGLFARFTDWIDMAGNRFEENKEDVFFEDVTNIFRREAAPPGLKAPAAMVTGPAYVHLGDEVRFSAAASADPQGRPLSFQWFIGGAGYQTRTIGHTFTRCGFHRVGVTANNGSLAGLAYRNVYVVGDGREIGTEGTIDAWTASSEGGRSTVEIRKAEQAVKGTSSTCFEVEPYDGTGVSFRLPWKDSAHSMFDENAELTFWLKVQNTNNVGFGGPQPIVRLHAGSVTYVYTPASGGRPRNLLRDMPYSEARYGWLYLTVPFKGNGEWLRTEEYEGERPLHVDCGLNFETVETPITPDHASSMASDGTFLYCIVSEGNRLFRSREGKKWEHCSGLDRLAPENTCSWINGMLSYYRTSDGRGRLYLRHKWPKRDAFGHAVFRFVVYDIATDTWSWSSVKAAMGHGACVAGDRLFGLAHAIMGNYGGPLCMFNLSSKEGRDDRSVLKGIKGENAHWYSRAAQLACLGGKVYGIKNDWITPQPEERKKRGDRLFCFDPASYAASQCSGRDLWEDKNWSAAETPAEDLGALPFEVGHGAALVVLPPRWGASIGDAGGLFILAGSSPSNHEGFGAPSDKCALYDIATKRFVAGRLPNVTGSGSSAALHNDKLFIKRGGLHYAAYNKKLWVVQPVSDRDAERFERQAKEQRERKQKINSVSLQFDSNGMEPFTIWIDGVTVKW